MEMVVEDQNQPKIAPNRVMFQEILEEGKEDRISFLPDCLILEILSRLPSTKEAIRTGTLSKRWEHLWTLLPTLIISFYHQNHPRSDFVSFIDKTLAQCRQSKLKKFELCIGFEPQVNSWIQYAVRCNVEELDLMLAGPFPLDQFLFNSSCFTDLRLSGCILNPTGAISWKNLRSLCISRGKLDEDFIEKILCGSPQLEILELHDCYDYQMLNITAKSLKKLVFCADVDPDSEDETGTSYDIRFVSQVNNWIRFAVRCSVEKLELTLWNTEIVDKYQVDQILFIGSCFTDLSLTLEGCKFNSIGAISWKNLMNLCISHAELDEDMIENILSGSPQLETLVLKDCYGYRRLDITSKSVKNLVFSGYDASDDHIIEINAPYILSLTIEESLYLCKLVLVNVSSLVKAKLDYEKDWQCEADYDYDYEEAEEEMFKGFILNLRHVKELEIGDSCSEVVSDLEEKGFVFPSNIKFTELT